MSTANQTNELTQSERLSATAAANTLVWSLLILAAWFLMDISVQLALYGAGFLWLANLDLGLKWGLYNEFGYAMNDLILIKAPLMAMSQDLLQNISLYAVILSLLNISPHIEAEFFLFSMVVLAFSRVHLFFMAAGEVRL